MSVHKMIDEDDRLPAITCLEAINLMSHHRWVVHKSSRLGYNITNVNSRSGYWAVRFSTAYRYLQMACPQASIIHGNCAHNHRTGRS